MTDRIDRVPRHLAGVPGITEDCIGLFVDQIQTHRVELNAQLPQLSGKEFDHFSKIFDLLHLEDAPVLMGQYHSPPLFALSFFSLFDIANCHNSRRRSPLRNSPAAQFGSEDGTVLALAENLIGSLGAVGDISDA